MPRRTFGKLSTGAVLLLALAVSFPDRAQAAGGSCGGGLIRAKVTLRDDPSDGIRSDGRATYVHCQDGQVSIGKKEGRFRLDTGKFNTTGAKARITLDAADCLAGPCSGVPVDVTTNVLFQTHTAYECSNPSDVSTCTAVEGTVLDLRTMAAGDVEYTRLNVGFGSGMLLFTNASDVLQGSPTCTGGNPVKVTCLSAASGSCNKWTMEGDKACYYKIVKQSRVFQGLVSPPFLATVELLP